MIEDIKSFLWFVWKGPKFYSTLFALILTKLKPTKDSNQHIDISTRWCEENISTVKECLLKIGVKEESVYLEEAFSQDYKEKISRIIDGSASDFGGPGHTNLIYTICEKLEIKKIKKQPTEKRLYNLKDYVVYPKHGVGQITEFKKINIGVFDVETYVIKF